jgi:hypothetical protein
VTYAVAPDAIENKIQILKPTTVEKLPISGKKVSSPQGTRWFFEIDPDYKSVVKPWNTTLEIGNNSHDEILLEAHFVDHGNDFSAHWINEELLFVQVWWGRIVSSDLIIDVSSGKLIYDRLANYGQLGEPCQ